jgi:hypothetical protein
MTTEGGVTKLVMIPVGGERMSLAMIREGGATKLAMTTVEGVTKLVMITEGGERMSLAMIREGGATSQVMITEGGATKLAMTTVEGVMNREMIMEDRGGSVYRRRLSRSLRTAPRLASSTR